MMMKSKRVDPRYELVALARKAATKGQLKEALSAMAKLKIGLTRSDDVAWVIENEAEIKAMPTPAPIPGFFPRIHHVQWRVDVTISTSSLERVMRPSVMMRLALSDGQIKTFEMSIEQFHKLRYSVARVLRNMQEIERNPIMRLIDSSSS
mmetsp:Transcript_12323/g.16631  ORF Transcript_12323/g.16631 Transcript_12323/m.16631 type:complete len:150 (+) Transcript_12323:55-504(+)